MWRQTKAVWKFLTLLEMRCPELRQECSLLENPNPDCSLDCLCWPCLLPEGHFLTEHTSSAPTVGLDTKDLFA